MRAHTDTASPPQPRAEPPRPRLLPEQDDGGDPAGSPAMPRGSCQRSVRSRADAGNGQPGSPFPRPGRRHAGRAVTPPPLPPPHATVLLGSFSGRAACRQAASCGAAYPPAAPRDQPRGQGRARPGPARGTGLLLITSLTSTGLPPASLAARPGLTILTPPLQPMGARDRPLPHA